MGKVSTLALYEIRNERWHEEHKMSWTTFNIMYDLLRSYVQRQVTFYRDPIGVEQAIAMVFKRSTFKNSITHIANLYSSGSSTLQEYNKLVTDALFNKGKLFSQLISVSSRPTLANIIKKNQKYTWELSNVWYN